MGKRVLSDGVVERYVGNVGHGGFVGIDGGELLVLIADFGAFERPRIGLGFGKEDAFAEQGAAEMNQDAERLHGHVEFPRLRQRLTKGLL